MDTTPASTEQDAAGQDELVAFLNSGDEAPEATQAPDPAPAQAEQPTSESQDTGSRPRDEQGRFLKADVAAAAESGEPPTADAAQPTPAVPDKPFVYRAYGADHGPFTGAVERADGVFFPSDAVQRLRQTLAEGHNAESRRREMLRDAEQQQAAARTERQAEVDRANQVLNRLAELRKDPNALQGWFEDLDRNWAVLMAEADRDAMKAELVRQQAGIQEQQEAAEAERLTPIYEGLLDRTVREMITRDPELKHLDPAQAKQRLWTTFFDRIFYEADRDQPEANIRRGETVIDYDAIAAELRYEAALRKPVSLPAPAPVAQAAAVQADVASAASTKPTAPPVVSTKGSGAKARSGRMPEFKSTEDVDDWFIKGGSID